MKKHAIITSSDQKHGDFLINHWYRSLKANVNLTDIDVIVLDYDLSTAQREVLRKTSVKMIKSKSDGHIVNRRFLDAGYIISQINYDQILFIDGGDIIFQEDISQLFDENKNCFRAVKLDMEVMYFEYFIPRNFNSKIRKKLWRVLKGKTVLNAGVLFAPKDKFIYLCSQIDKLVTDKNTYGPDQVILNYILYQNQVKYLHKKYNFMLNTENEGFVIKNGIFYRKNGEKIVIVHNAGHNNFLRPIDNFGYGSDFNRLKYINYKGKFLWHQILGGIRKFGTPVRTPRPEGRGFFVL